MALAFACGCSSTQNPSAPDAVRDAGATDGTVSAVTDAGSADGRASGEAGAPAVDASGDGATSALAEGGTALVDAAPDATGPTGPTILAATPPMGWNSWNTFAGSVTDTVVRQTADAMVSSGMAAAGYQYIIIDDTWALSRGSTGTIVPDASRFPNMKALADYVHGDGLKFGIYSDRGTETCAGRPGSYGFETNDAQTYASWGVDYLKYDNRNPSTSSLGIQQDYTTMGNALVATGRPIVYSLSAWWFYPWEPMVGNLWRTTTDITDAWTSVTALLDRNGGDTSRYGSCTSCPDASGGSCVTCNADVPEAAYGAPGISSYATPGHWNDPDMLEVGNGGMTDTEYRSHFSLWAMMAAPLIAGNDLRNMTAATVTILTDPDIIAVDQDPLGIQGRPISTSTTLEVWSKRLSGTATYAVALFNRTAVAADITVTWSSLGIASGNATVRDLWAHADLGSMANQYVSTVPSHGGYDARGRRPVRAASPQRYMRSIRASGEKARIALSKVGRGQRKGDENAGPSRGRSAGGVPSRGSSLRSCPPPRARAARRAPIPS